MSTSTRPQIKVADEVWIATALLQRERPSEPDFSLEEIVDRAAKEAISESARPGVYVHAVQHCVANRPPNPGRYRMLYETRPGRRRLFRKGDTYNPAREGAKITPDRKDMPAAYESLLDWYRDWCASATKSLSERDPLLSLTGSGMHLWLSEEPADEYVRRLREGWV